MVPIAALRGTPFMQKALALAGLSSEEATTVANKDAVADTDVSTAEKEADIEAELAESEAAEIEEEEAPKKKTRKTRRTKAATLDENGDFNEEGVYTGKFVELLDLLPPVPQKGDFDVKTIKRSLYFFS